MSQQASWATESKQACEAGRTGCSKRRSQSKVQCSTVLHRSQSAGCHVSALATPLVHIRRTAPPHECSGQVRYLVVALHHFARNNDSLCAEQVRDAEKVNRSGVRGAPLRSCCNHVDMIVLMMLVMHFACSVHFFCFCIAVYKSRCATGAASISAIMPQHLVIAMMLHRAQCSADKLSACMLLHPSLCSSA